MAMIQSTSNADFEERLNYGREAEDVVLRWFQRKGFYVQPKYLYCDEGAPSLFGLKSKYAVPDLDVAREGSRFWVEVKRKRLMKTKPLTGFPYRNYQCYKTVETITGDRVYVVFYDERLRLMYGNWLSELEKHMECSEQDWNTERLAMFKYPEAFVELAKLPLEP